MATATIARPSQAIRRRDAPRPGLAKRTTTSTNGTAMDGTAGSERPSKQRRLNEPYVRTSPYILRKHKGKPPSFKIHLHDTFFRFDGQEGSLQYDSPMRFVIQHLKDQTVPHELLEELLSNNVPFYDGCLIVEVHNHRTAAGKERSKQAPGATADKFSMHHYNQHITPSPLVPYPPKAAIQDGSEQEEPEDADDTKAEKQEKGKDKDGPKISLLVLHPTPLTQHHEMLILANTPLADARTKKKGNDNATPSSAQPQTPQLSHPQTPIGTSRGPLSGSQKMALEDGDFYTFQADLLVATEPPLYLEPASTPEQSDKIISMLSNPLHQGKPPSPQTRKRTTAEMAADDAQAAEAERRMLIMDERIKPSARAGAGNASNENQGTAASLGFSRFKTLEMVRQKHEEQDRVKKEEEARAEQEKRQANESQIAQTKLMQQKMRLQQQQQHQQQQQQQQQQANQQSAALASQQRTDMLRQQQMAAIQRQAQMNDHGHPQANGGQNGQQGNFQHSSTISQGSPIARQQTPMGNSSPMLPNGGFPMVPTSSQGAGSPPRPTSAALQNRNNQMARQVSQQQHGSQQNTPQIPQGTPSMAQAIPNRQMTQTPRMQPGSPANGMQGTPTPATMTMPTPQMGHQNALTPEQVAMLQFQRSQQNGMHAGSPPPGINPEQIQQIQRAQHQARQQAMLAQAQRSGNPQMVQHLAAQQRMMRQAQMQAQLQQQGMMQQQAGQSGSPNGIHQATPQMGHAHPSQTPGHQQQQLVQNAGQGQMPTPDQQAAAQAKAQTIAMQRQMMAQLNNLATQHGGLHMIPPQTVNALPPQHRQLLNHTIQNQRARAAQQQARLQQQQQQQQHQQLQANGDHVPANPNPAYMAALRNNQAAMMAQLQANQQQQQQQGMGGMAMNVNMNMNGMPQQQQQNGNGGNNGQGLDQYFANMQNALNQQQQGRGQQGGQGQ